MANAIEAPTTNARNCLISPTEASHFGVTNTKGELQPVNKRCACSIAVAKLFKNKDCYHCHSSQCGKSPPITKAGAFFGLLFVTELKPDNAIVRVFVLQPEASGSTSPPDSRL